MQGELVELFEKLSANLEAAKLEAEEFSNGKKKSAGKLRKEAQTGKVLWQAVRVVVMNKLKEMPIKKRDK